MSIPKHPGSLLQELLVVGKGMTITEIAEQLGYSTVFVSQLLKARRRMTVAVAIKIAKCTKIEPEKWLAMQQRCDLFNAQKKLSMS